jgi:hypothetical protein
MCQHCNKEISYASSNLYYVKIESDNHDEYNCIEICLCEDCLKKLKELLNNFILF